MPNPRIQAQPQAPSDALAAIETHLSDKGLSGSPASEPAPERAHAAREPQERDAPETDDFDQEVDRMEAEESAGSEETVVEIEQDYEPAIDPPASWSQEDKDWFATLPPETQAVVSRRESEREQHLTRRTQEASEARTRAEAEHQAATQERQLIANQFVPLIQQLSQIVSQGQTNLDALFQEATRTGDWSSYLFAERQQKQAMEAQRVASEQYQSHQQLILRQNRDRNANALASKVPEWSKGEKLASGVKEVLDFATSQYGFPAEFGSRIVNDPIGASAILMARDAMLHQRNIKAMQDKRSVVQKKVEKAPPVQKSGAVKPRTQAQIEGTAKAVLTNRQRATAQAGKARANMEASADRIERVVSFIAKK